MVRDVSRVDFTVFKKWVVITQVIILVSCM